MSGSWTRNQKIAAAGVAAVALSGAVTVVVMHLDTSQTITATTQVSFTVVASSDFKSPSPSPLQRVGSPRPFGSPTLPVNRPANYHVKITLANQGPGVSRSLLFGLTVGDAQVASDASNSGLGVGSSRTGVVVVPSNDVPPGEDPAKAFIVWITCTTQASESCDGTFDLATGYGTGSATKP
jgi:hypothetical protein